MHDPSLWQILDLKSYKSKFNLNKLKSFINIYGTDALTELNLSGNFDEIKKYDLKDELKQLYYLDVDFLNRLTSKSKNLEIISFEYFNLVELNMSMFKFKYLKSLTFKWCTFNSLINEQALANSYQIFTNLQTLNLIRISTPITQYEVELISKLAPNLVNFTINEAKSSFNDDCVKYLLNLFRLEKLELINTLITDLTIVELCKSVYLKMGLKHLNLSMSSKLSNMCLELIGSSFYELNSLWLTSCFGFTNIFLLENLSKLKYLNVNNTSIEKKLILNFIQKLSTCEVEFNHEKILSSKFNWTINGSKNCVCSF